MPNTQLIRRRIKSVGNTRQITKAMELVAAAKMRKAQDLAVRSKFYSQAANETLLLLKRLIKKDTHRLLIHRPIINRELLVVVASDKGLAGSYNSFVLRLASKLISSRKHPVDLVTIGKKSEDFFKRTDREIVASFINFPPYPSILDMRPIVDVIKNDFLKRKYDTVSIVYTKFHSTIKQEAVSRTILPITLPESIENEITPADQRSDEYIFEPNQKEVLNSIVPRLFETLVYQHILESIASEHSARMVAMKNASDNAKDIINDLQLLYNSLRQASITQELAEITSGAAALE